MGLAADIEISTLRVQGARDNSPALRLGLSNLLGGAALPQDRVAVADLRLRCFLAQYQ